MSGISIRRAHPGDVELIAGNNAALARETEGRRLERQTLEAGVAEILAQPRHGFYLLAERGGRVVGQALVTCEWSDWRNADFWWLQSVYVLPEQRARGVFKALYRHIFTEARRNPTVCGLRLYVHRDNRTAQAVYSSLGMERAHYLMYEADFSTSGENWRTGG